MLTHLIFSTKDRVAVLDNDIRSELHSYLAGVLENIDCPTLQVGGVSDHVHLFFGLSRNIKIADLVGTVKTSSSKWLKDNGRRFSQFHWQKGYGVFSISQSDSDDVITYIQNQDERHKRMAFQEEYRLFLKRYHVEYDESYVWD